MKEDVKPARTLDCLGLYCPEPLFQTREAMDNLGVGDVLEQRFVLRLPHGEVPEGAADGWRLQDGPSGNEVYQGPIAPVAVHQGDPLEPMVGDALGHVHAIVDEVVGLDMDGAGEVDVVEVQSARDGR